VSRASTEDQTSEFVRTSPRQVGRWLPVVLWASVIWMFSTGLFDGAGTGGILLPLLGGLLPFLDPDALEWIHQALRKTAHLVEFAILALLLARALDRPERTGLWLGVTTVGGCLLWAAVDEVHQSFVPTRVGALQDVILDTAGAGLGFLFYRWRGISSDRRSPA